MRSPSTSVRSRCWQRAIFFASAGALLRFAHLRLTTKERGRKHWCRNTDSTKPHPKTYSPTFLQGKWVKLVASITKVSDCKMLLNYPARRYFPDGGLTCNCKPFKPRQSVAPSCGRHQNLSGTWLCPGGWDHMWRGKCAKIQRFVLLYLFVGTNQFHILCTWGWRYHCICIPYIYIYRIVQVCIFIYTCQTCHISCISYIHIITHIYTIYIDIQYQNLSTVTKYDSCAPWILNRFSQDLRVMVCTYLHELNAQC